MFPKSVMKGECLDKSKVGDEIWVRIRNEGRIQIPYPTTMIGWSKTFLRPIIGSNIEGSLESHSSCINSWELKPISKQFKYFAICAPILFDVVKIIKK